MTDRTINETECELCHRTIISGRMVEALHGGYVCEECCMGLVDGEMVTVGVKIKSVDEYRRKMAGIELPPAPPMIEDLSGSISFDDEWEDQSLGT